MKILCLILTALMVLSCCAFAEGGGEDELNALLSGMTLREKAAQMMLPSFRTWKDENGASANITELNAEIRDVLARERFGGVLLFGQNIADPEQTLALVADMQETNLAGGGLPLLIAADEEGGSVARLSYGVIGVGNMALGATGDPENARRMAAIHGAEIGLAGINANFAPVVDVNSNAANPVIGIRSFSDDPQTVAEYGRAYIEGLHGAGIMAAVKHFPGHGNTDTDSHTGFPVIDSTREELLAGDLIPFRAGIEAGADMVMTAHIQFPQIEKETYTSVSTGEQVYLPATMSRVILTDILRGELGFEGVIVSDALEMAAVAQNFSPEDMLRLAINAGVDLLILPSVYDAESLQKVEALLDTAVALVESGAIDEARLDDAVLRILAMKRKYGLLDRQDFSVTEEKLAAARAGIGSAEHRAAEWDIAEKALTLVKNENSAFPVTLAAGEKALILFADSCASRAGTGELAAKLLREAGALPEGAEITVMKNTADNEAECVEAARAADHVILVHRVYAAACLDPATGDGFSSGAFDKIIDAVHEAGKTVIVVSCQLPYDAARFPEADAVLLTYWSSAMRELPKEGSSWSVNLPAGLLSCFGLYSAEGRLPVSIPALDESYKYTDDILYPRGYSASPSARLRAFYNAMTEGWKISEDNDAIREYGDDFLKTELREGAIVITEVLEEGKSLTWTYVQEGDWLTAPLGPDEAEGRAIAYLLLNDAISAQGVPTDLFLGYLNALREKQINYLAYGESEDGKTVSVNIAGPYEYDPAAMESLAISEEYLLEEGHKPLSEEYELIDAVYGRVKLFGAANADGLSVTVREYGGLDELAYQAIVSYVKVLQPKGWEQFIAEYTELKDAETADFFARVNLDENGLEDAWMNYKEGYGFAHFSVGDNILEE